MNMIKNRQKRKNYLKNEDDCTTNGWRYYKHAMIPDSAPHETINKIPLKNGTIWKSKKGIPLFARWISEWDCGYETNWWYVIKDDKFDINNLKSKRRYEIKKGQKNFEVVQIVAKDYALQLFEITLAAYKEYPRKYRPQIEKKAFIEEIDNWNKYRTYGAFSRDTKELCGYALLSIYENYVDFNVLKTRPDCEKRGVNAAIIGRIVTDFNKYLSKSFYICDGSRAVLHETNFQDYLEKYFGFRKAYCKLHMKYRGLIKGLVKILYPLRNYIKGNGKLTTRIKTVLLFEEIAKTN